MGRFVGRENVRKRLAGFEGEQAGRSMPVERPGSSCLS
jgi:hypothetical protein